MSRNYGIMSGRSALGGTSDRPSAYSADMRADLSLLPGRPALKRGYLAQAVFDVLTLIVWIFLGLLIAFVVGGPILAAGWMVLCR